MPNVWTPLGWKNHLFRFNVLYTGDILAEPDPRSPFGKKDTQPYAGLGVQLSFFPTGDGSVPPSRTQPHQLCDSNGNRTAHQGWEDRPTPVLWTEWRQPNASLNGIVLKEQVFGHITSSEDVQSGVEPLFGWIRISVAQHLEMIPRPSVGVMIKINAPHVQWSMWPGENLMLNPQQALYPRALSARPLEPKQHPGCLLSEEEGKKIRLAILPGRAESIRFIGPPAKDGHDQYLYVTLPAQEGAYVDLLLPFLPTDRAQTEQEMSLGYDDALKQSDAYWSRTSPTAARIHTPEPLVNRMLEMTPKLAEIIAEKNPETGQYAALCGSSNYASVWATPESMQMSMLLDPLGYHDIAARYLEIFKQTQGTAKPPGPSYDKHPGYLSAPRTLSSVDWLTDHGAILYAICRHGLLSGDAKFVNEYLPTVIRACEFIHDARHKKGQAGVRGVLPPAAASDRAVPEQSLWSDGWNYKGLVSAVAFLRQAGRTSEADAFAREAEDYRAAFGAAVEAKLKIAPTWKDSHGKSHPLVPTAFSNGDPNHPFYLDTGPLFLVFSGLMRADSLAMRDALLYFRDGPNLRAYDPLGNFNQPAVLVHEISSCEPCYSWNIYHSWQLADRERFLEGMYSLITGGMSRQTFISSEHRGGISGTQFVAPQAVNLIRLSVIDDEIESGSLHLMRLCPPAWIRSDQQTRFEKMPTLYGPVDLSFGLSPDGKRLEVTFKGDWRAKAPRVVLHVPPVAGLTGVKINGKSYPIQDEIELNF
jgi:hypothetical protein